MSVTKAATGWIFTINNPNPEVKPPSIPSPQIPEGWHEGYQDHPYNWRANHGTKFSKGVRYLTYQKEVGENGTPHFQGYVEFEQAKRLSAVKKISPRAHWEIRAGTPKQAAQYANKPETRVAGPWTDGESGPGKGSRTDLESVGRESISGIPIKAITEQNPGLFMQYGRGMRDLAMTTQGKYDHDDVRGIWYWGGPGTGKSRKAREQYPDAYLKAQNKWFDGYAGEKEIILDDLDKLGGDKLGHYLKIWADRYACTAEVKGATVHLQHRVIVITSNYHPDTMWPEDEEMLLAIKRRFKIVHFLELKTNKRGVPVGFATPAAKRAAIEDGPPTLLRSKTLCSNGCPDNQSCMCAQSSGMDV